MKIVPGLAKKVEQAGKGYADLQTKWAKQIQAQIDRDNGVYESDEEEKQIGSDEAEDDAAATGD